ncbi:MAG TPA: MazG nucleotide pyrophosphohydrolase domain-containing protein, partial [Pilimelia sp.]|nr:MazG nucleotide pyrophosphohydrolase domain-containing protein [Pilimelia sp.]
ARFLLEECYEAYDAIEAGDLAALREELGDLLLQVVLHARLAAAADPPWTVDDVAGDLAAKLVRRSPHVFGDVRLTDLDGITAQWERIKREEKGRTSALDGIALSQPALALAAKVCDRSARAALPTPPAGESYADERYLGEALLSLVVAARAAGQDPEAALRRAALAHMAALRAAESDGT